MDESVYGDLRVLDLSGEAGVYCGKLLADLGAEVVKVEQPGGDPMRRIGPFAGDIPHPERSLHWFFFNTNKKSITLDLSTPDGRDLFADLAKTADIVIESFDPGYLASLGLGYDDLSKSNPGLVMTSVTPYGQTGPHRHHRGANIVAAAMGGQMYLAGIPGEPPMQPGENQSFYQASLHAAVGTLIALHLRDATGLGQHVDVSQQESITLSLEFAINYWDVEKYVRTRTGIDHRIAGLGVYPCLDGYIFTTAGFTGWDQLVAWMKEEGWELDLGESALAGRGPVGEMVDIADATLIPFFLGKTRQEIVEALQGRHVGVMPVNTPEDLVNSPQLNARGFFSDVDHPELDATYAYPGGPYRFNEIEWGVARRAPLVGEHNAEIYGELGLSADDLVALAGSGVI